MKRNSAVKQNRETIEFGDYQTPPALAAQVCEVLARRGISPRSLLEPTCGTGSLLRAALDRFPSIESAVGIDINERYVQATRTSTDASKRGVRLDVLCQDFFQVEFKEHIRHTGEPILVLGNPPWVTNAGLGVIGSSNLPKKRNFQQHIGLDALTGKSNFDISEWMLIRLLEVIVGRKATIAMLCKTAVARRVLTHAWKNEFPIHNAALFRIDSQRHFSAAVDACLFICECTAFRNDVAANCDVYETLDSANPSTMFGLRESKLVSDIAAFDRLNHLSGDSAYRWRSGIKHDSSKVMTFVGEGDEYRNGLGDVVPLETDRLFPMLRSSEIAKGDPTPSRWMLVTQFHPGDDTALIEHLTPKTWAYLQRYATQLRARASSIYRNRPPFAMFGIGPYSFASHKVAISGLYKQLRFVPLAPFAGRPIVLDDTCYFIDCQCAAEAKLLAGILNSQATTDFYSSLIFWDSKRPITIDVLGRLSIEAAARELSVDDELQAYITRRTMSSDQRVLF
jgi:hypothetical protein